MSMAVVGGCFAVLPAEGAAASPRTISGALSSASPVGGINFGGAYEQTFDRLPLTTQTATMRQIAGLGITWIRVNVPFDSVEPSPGVFNWYPDTLMRLAVANGINVVALISYPPAWALAADGSPDPAGLGTFAGVVAGHLKGQGVHTYEVINEPNMGANWGGQSNPAEYASVLRAAYSAIKRTDPLSTVITGGLAPAADAPDGSSRSPLTFLREVYAAGGGPFFDAANIHPYTYPDMPLQADSWNPFFNLPEIRNLMVSQGDAGKLVWLTEYGAPTQGPRAVSPAKQAQMIGEAFGAIKNWPWAGPLFLFDWVDTSGDGSFGIFDSSGAPKPAAAAVSQALGASPPPPPVNDPVAAYYGTLGGGNSFLGGATDNEHAVGGGTVRDFAGGAIFWSSSTGPHAVHGAILGHYQALGGPTGFLGFPVNDETGTPDGIGRFNHFANGGSIYWTPRTGAWSIHGAILDRWAAMGWERSSLGYPTSDENGIPGGRQNSLVGGMISWDSASGGTAIISR